MPKKEFVWRGRLEVYGVIDKETGRRTPARPMDPWEKL